MVCSLSPSVVGFAMTVSQMVVAVVVYLLVVLSARGVALESGFCTLGVVGEGLILVVSTFPFELPPVL